MRTRRCELKPNQQAALTTASARCRSPLAIETGLARGCRVAPKRAFTPIWHARTGRGPALLCAAAECLVRQHNHACMGRIARMYVCAGRDWVPSTVALRRRVPPNENCGGVGHAASARTCLLGSEVYFNLEVVELVVNEPLTLNP